MKAWEWLLWMPFPAAIVFVPTLCFISATGAVIERITGRRWPGGR